MRKLILIAGMLLCASLSGAQEYKMDWRRDHMDGSRTGVTAPNSDNVPQALGTVRDGTYTAPNGKVFGKGSATSRVADIMISIQPEMAFVKERIGFSPKEMNRSERPENELSNLIVDRIMVRTAEVTGKKIDVGITNFGGIRVDLPQGDVLLDDIISMLPFENYLCYVQLRGSDLRALYEQMAQTGMQAVGGVKLVVKDKTLVSAEIGGEPLDDDRLYGLATIDFLLDGGDNFSCAKNAEELIITETLVRDSLLPYLRELKAEGKFIEYKKDGRVVVL